MTNSSDMLPERRKLAALLHALNGQKDLGSQHFFVELAYSHIREFWPELAKVVWPFIRVLSGHYGDEAVAPNVIGEAYSGNPLGERTRFHVDLFVLTIKDVELDAVIYALSGEDVSNQIEPTFIDAASGKALYFFECNGRAIGVGCVKEDGLTQTAVALSQYSTFLTFKKCCLVGMAGGKAPKQGKGVNLCDVVIGTRIHDADRRRILPKGDVIEEDGGVRSIEARIVAEKRNFPVRSHLVRSHRPSREWWIDVIRGLPDRVASEKVLAGFEALSEMKADWLRVDSTLPRVRNKPILSGGALVEDSSETQRLIDLYDPEAVAIDMESFGFAAWCEGHRIFDWMVLRGISDYCGPSPAEVDGKLPRNDDDDQADRPVHTQFPATYFAACVLRDHVFPVLFSDVLDE